MRQSVLNSSQWGRMRTLAIFCQAYDANGLILCTSDIRIGLPD